MRGVMLSAVHPTSEYAAIIDAGSELVIGATATPAIDALTVGQLGAAFADDTRTAWTFADCTLPAPVIAALLEDRRAGGPPLAVDAVSTSKAAHLPRDLHGIDLLFLDEDEARALLGSGAANDAAEAARALRERGAAALVLTRSARGVVVAGAGGTVEIAVPRRLRSTSSVRAMRS